MRLLLFCCLALLGLSTQAQQITGVAKDAQGNPVSNATISLLRDTVVVKFTVSKDNGSYSFSGIKEGKYRVSATHVGFTPFYSQPFTVTATDVTVPAFQMAKAADNMSNVVVQTRKPIVEVKADKMILNVEGTINSTGTDAFELLRKSPGVQVDKDDNISVNGKNGVQIYIDGRPTPLTGQDLSNYLKTLQSNQIEAIEIITNPSAKYEAAGNAGIINIRLKKDKSIGTNGSANAGWNLGTYPKYNAGISINHRSKSVNVYGSYSYNTGSNTNSINLNRTVADTLFDQHGDFVYKNNTHNYKAGVDYFINKQSTIGVMVNGSFSNPSLNNYSSTAISYVPTNTLNRTLVANNSSELKRDNQNYNLNYTYNGTKGKSLVINADYGHYNPYSNQLQPNIYYGPTGNILSMSSYRMLSPSDINISSLKVDWEQDFEKGKLGYGGKLAYVKTMNNFTRNNANTNPETLIENNSFDYKENINAAYVNYNRQFKSIMIQAGLRLENTVSRGTSAGTTVNGGGVSTKSDSTFKRNYTDLFPSAAITFNKNPMSQFSLTYSRRIDRPAYQDLNPFEFRLDDYTFQKGNVDLIPQYTNSFGLTHTYKYRLNTTINYSHVKNMFVQLIDTINKTRSFISKRNLATQDIVSFNMSYPFSYKAYTMFANLSSNYAHYNANFGPGRVVDINSFGLTLYAQNSIKIDKKKTWTGELTGFYNAPTVYQGAFKAHGLWSIDAGLSKQLWSNKGTIKASVSDIFNTLHFVGTQDFAGQKTVANVKWESQQFKLAFVYRFGSNTVKAARQRTQGSEDENKRANQQGGGGIGIGNQ